MGIRNIFGDLKTFSALVPSANTVILIDALEHMEKPDHSPKVNS